MPFGGACFADFFLKLGSEKIVIITIVGAPKENGINNVYFDWQMPSTQPQIFPCTCPVRFYFVGNYLHPTTF